FSNNFHQEMMEIKRSLADMNWPKMPAEKHIAFFEDLSKLRCHTIDTRSSRLAVPSMANDIINFCYVAWMLRSITQSPVTTLCLHSLSDGNLLELSKLSLHHLQDVTLLSCTFSFAAVATFLESQQHIKSLYTGAWSPISSITGSKGRRRSNRGLKTSLEPATRMSLSSINGTATAIRALLSTPETFPYLEQVGVTDGDVTGMQEALLLISHIPTAYHLCLCLQDLNEWLQFKFPRGRGVERAESLLKMITDLTMPGISPDNIPAVAGLIPNLKRFQTSSTFLDISEKDILDFVKRMKDACPGLETVHVDWSDFFTDPKWLQQK
ncbi:hypothetical protein EV421DRAFT_1869933, partial [Armillaria borealis]